MSSDKIGHIPKADDLHSVRDLLYIIFSHDGSMDEDKAFQEMNKLLFLNKLSNWARPTFDEYRLLVHYLDLAKPENLQMKLNDRIEGFLARNKWTPQAQLNNSERDFFRGKILRYKAVLRFLEVVFCEGKDFRGRINRLIESSHAVKERKRILSIWMDRYHLTDDRSARAVLSWCMQTGVIERDEFSDTYFLTKKGKPRYDLFVMSLIKNYEIVFDRDLRRAKIPELRAMVCKDLHMSARYFDKMLEEVQENNPTSLSMDRATVAREEVAKYGIKQKSFYYYYIKLDGKEIK